MTFKLTRLTDYSKTSIKDEIVRVAGIVGGTRLTRADFKKHARVSITTVRRKFDGGWKEALEFAGLGELYVDVSSPGCDPIASRGIEKEGVIAELHRISSLVAPDPITTDLFRRRASFGIDVVRNRFGSWNEALKAAGLHPSNHGRRYTDEECFSNLLDVWTALGRQPLYREMSDTPSVVGGKAYVKRWGSWVAALHAFSDYVDAPATEPALVRTERPTKPKAVDGDQRDPPLGLRYRVLVRDRFKCVYCGRSPASDLKCKLHIDHIDPFSRGGKTVFENLQVLCEECNLGKGDAIPPRGEPQR